MQFFHIEYEDGIREPYKKLAYFVRFVLSFVCLRICKVIFKCQKIVTKYAINVFQMQLMSESKSGASSINQV